MDPFVFVTNHEDWEGLYINGNLVIEDHTIRRQDVIRHVQGYTGAIAQYYVEPEWLQARGNLPPTLVEIPEDQIIERTAYS